MSAEVKTSSKPGLMASLFETPTKKQIEDYNFAINGLIWQRQAIFFAALVLAAVYFDPIVAITAYTCVLLTEILDLSLARRIRTWEGADPRTARSINIQICVNTVLSASAISIFILLIALQQGPGGHFTPLFFLFAAALFAVMNNHQILLALILRVSIYALAFFTVATVDLWFLRPPLGDRAWLEFFTTIFVLYFILDVSIVFYKMYRRSQAHLERLVKEHKRTKKAYQIKSDFVSTVSHELRTPLTSIKGALDLVNEGSLGEVPDTMTDLLRVAGENCERLQALINDVLDVQQLEAGQFVGELLPLDAEKLVVEIAEANVSYASKHGVGLDYVPGQVALPIVGDGRRLGQVLSNLISNAVKFSTKGETVTIWTQAKDGKVRIYVQDTGIGIPDGARDKVFGQFSQVDTSDQRGVGGTGLGLHISQRIVKAHGGRLDYVSRLGRGSTFFVELALNEDRVSTMQVDRIRPTQRSARDVQRDNPIASPA